MAKGKDSKPATKLASVGRRKEWTGIPGQPGGVVNPPIWRSSTHLYENSADLDQGRPNEDGHFYYGRRGAPTQWALAEALTELEPGAYGTQLYPSGVAAIAGALLSVLRAGDVLLMTDNAYQPSRAMAQGLLKHAGIETRWFDPLDLDGFADHFCERTKAVLLEAPGSLTMEVCDIPALAAIAREKGAVSLLDNTWATPLGFAALAQGCDLSIMSLTKHVGGHSDLMMGSVTAAEPQFARLRRTSQQLGQVVSPDDAALALRGLRTLSVRLEKETSSALEIAKWLSNRPEIARILCPMLPGAPGHELWARDFTGGCGLFSFTFKGGDEAARARFVDALTLFGIGFSWGGYESLVIPFDPAGTRSATPWPPADCDPADRFGIRLSIGLEDAGDLIADLEGALAAMGERLMAATRVPTVSGADGIKHAVSAGNSQVGSWIEWLDSYAIQVGSTHLSLWSASVFVAVIFAVIVFGRIGSRLAHKIMARLTSLDLAQQLLAEKIVTIAVWGFAILAGIDVLGIDLTALAVFSGAFGLALGFGLQKTFGNLLAGIILLMDRSIKPGDVIAVSDMAGRESFGQIRKIGIRAISVTTRDMKEYLIPNENLMINQVENWSYSSRDVRIKAPIRVAYGSDIDLVEKLLIEACEASPRVLDLPEAKALIIEFGESAINFEIRFWVQDPEEGISNVRSDVYKRAWKLFQENGIRLPYPQLDLHLRDSQQVQALLEAAPEGNAQPAPRKPATARKKPR